MAEKNLEEMREAVEAIREKMAAAAREAGRDPAEVQLCAACKTRTADTVAASAALAHRCVRREPCAGALRQLRRRRLLRQAQPLHRPPADQQNQKVLGRASLIQSVGSETSAGRHRRRKPPGRASCRTSCWK
ncbi:MAG: hypothetical protein ACLVJH_10180 [Faecalibacterium prausnitzii]